MAAVRPISAEPSYGTEENEGSEVRIHPVYVSFTSAFIPIFWYSLHR